MNFPRQPLPVKVTLEGEHQDVDVWMIDFIRFAERKGDVVQWHGNIFTIYPRAVND
jgi:hypothetical protein